MIDPSGTVVPCTSTSRCDPSGLHGRRRLEAKDLLDRVRDQGGVLDEQSALVRVLGEQLHREADEACRGLVPGAGDHAGVGDDLVPGERPP